MKPRLLLLCAIAFCSFVIFSKTASTKNLKTTNVSCYITECRPEYKDAQVKAELEFNYCMDVAESEYNTCKISANVAQLNDCTGKHRTATNICEQVLQTAESLATEAFLLCKNNCSNE